MAKLPVGLKSELDRIQDEQIPHVAGILARVKADCPNLPSWYKEKPAAYYEGKLSGLYCTIEGMLHAYNCYEGFSEKRGKMHNTEFAYECYFF